MLESDKRNTKARYEIHPKPTASIANPKTVSLLVPVTPLWTQNRYLSAGLRHIFLSNVRKQPSRGVLRKTCSEKMH